MKSSFWVLGSVTLLYLGVVRCSRDFLDNDEHFLDKKRDEDEERTLKDENTEWALYKAIYNWNELPKEINELSLLQRSDAAVCTNDMCFEGGKCSADNICTCGENQYFDGKQCQDLCNLKDYNKTCLCPPGTVRDAENGECVPEDRNKLCTRNCGYGVCVKEKQNEENVETDNCKCFSDIAEPNEDKCILKKSLCASNELDSNSLKCKCERNYKYAEDGITCVLKNCNDEDVQTECRNKNEECVMDWKGDGYKCICPSGQKENDESEKCKDLCKDVTCYRGQCIKVNGSCGCDPGYKGKHCEELEENECKTQIIGCFETGGTCKIMGQKQEIKCDCSDDKEYVDNKGCLKIEDVNCKKICGDNSEVKCGGNKMIQEQIECSCTDETKDFFKDEKECKTNYCKKECGTDEKVKCEAENQYENLNIKCSCKDDDYVFKDKKCIRSADVPCLDFPCYNGGTCKVENEEAKCLCLEGFSGDHCEIKIEDINCKEICGDNPEVVCGGNKKDKKTIKCSCKNTTKDFDEGAKECKINYCKVKCKDAKCDGNKFVEDEVVCSCSEPDKDFDDQMKKCKINYCKRTCGTTENVKCDAEDEYKNVNIKCSCYDEEYIFKDKKCIQKCSENTPCENEGICEGKEGEKVCRCKPGTIGDLCEKIVACEEGGKYGKCRDGKGDCKFTGGKAVCECPENHKLYEDGGYCDVQCENNESCGGNRICNKANFCVCKKGWEGDNCDVVTGCKKLNKECEDIGKACEFDETVPDLLATCKCGENLKYYREKKQCLHEFCYPDNPCKKPANCTFDESTKVGFCKCPENQFYSYEAEKCKEFDDKCLLRKISCGKNEECNKKTGKCECKGKKEGEECKWNFCDTKPCFTGANCTENERCFCAEGKYYKNKACKAADCNIKNYKTSCKCPAGKREKDDGECVVEKKEKCENMTEADCGYGICKKVSNKDSCKCFTFAENNKALKGKCILRKELCASGKLQENDPMKCKCEGIYKQADDGITCTLRTCDDDDVKEKCESLGGKCVMRWKGDGYDCECPEGYDKDNNGKCSDPCSVEKNFKECTKKGQVCYNSFSATNKITTSCNCPPTVKLVNGKCEEKAENAYLFKNIPVLKEKYELKSGINKVLLNKHLVQSLQQTFKKDLYEFGYLFDYNVQGDIVNCSVWVNFRKAPTDKDLKKIKAASKTFSTVCDDCDDSLMIWPPNLFLSSTGLKEVEPDKQDFCKVKDRLCGKGAKCTQDEKNGKCTCDEGYQVVQYGILKIGPYEVQVCEDINECALGTHKCPTNTECFNTIGNYSCVCKEGFKKEKPPVDPETDKSGCVDLCTPSPCKKGKCVINEKEKTFDCECEPGVAGSYCQRADEHYKSAKKSTVVVGAVLGTILIVGAIAVIYFIIKKKKRFGSEDFMPAPRMDHAEMTERRHIRGVTNKAYE